MTITWQTKMVKIGELKDYKDNPRVIKKDAYKRLVKSVQENGYTNRLIVNTNNIVLAGNQRLKVLIELGFDEVEILYPDRELTIDEEKRINITDNIHAGIWDTDALVGAWDVEELKEWGISDKLFDLETESHEKIEKPKKPKTCQECGAEF